MLVEAIVNVVVLLFLWNNLDNQIYDSRHKMFELHQHSHSYKKDLEKINTVIIGGTTFLLKPTESESSSI